MGSVEMLRRKKLIVMTQWDQNVLHLYFLKTQFFRGDNTRQWGVQSRNDSCCTYLKTKMFLLLHCHVSYCYGLSAIHDDIAVIVAS